MHLFNYTKRPLECFTPEIVAMIANIHEHKGRQDLFITVNKDKLNSLLDVAKIQSIGASNRIESIFTTDKSSN